MASPRSDRANPPCVRRSGRSVRPGPGLRLSGSTRALWQSYGLSLLLSAAACSFTLASMSDGPPRPALYFVLSVVLSAWFGGIGPGLLATAIGAACSAAFYRYGGLAAMPEPGAELRVLLFLGLCSPLCWLIDRYLAARRQASESERDRQASEARYRNIVDTAHEGIWAFDGAGNTAFVNPRLCQILGYSETELEGRPLRDFLFEEDRTRVGWEFEQLLRGETRRFEVRLKGRDGEGLWTLISASPFPEEPQGAAGVLWMVADLSGQKSQEVERLELLARAEAARTQAEQAQRRLAFLAEATALLSSSLDYGQTLERLTRLTLPELADWCVLDIITEEGEIRRRAIAHADPEQTLVAARLVDHIPAADQDYGVARVLRDGTPQVIRRVSARDLEALAPDPVHRELLRELGTRSYACLPLRLRGRTLGAITLVYGESGRTHGDTEIALAEELAGRAAYALDNAFHFREAQEGSLRKDEFLAILAHELRSPLAAIANAAYLLQHAGEQRVSLARIQQVVERQSQHLSRLVEDLLDVSRISRGKVEVRPEPVELLACVQRAVETVRPLVEARAHILTLAVEETEAIWVHGDPIRLNQVFANLLTNAARYTEPGGQITIVIRASPHPSPSPSEAPSVEIEVRDSGIGIPPERLERIFEPFFQGPAASGQDYRGLGIGLALVHHLVELHGGTVTVASAGTGCGSAFTVRLPRQSPTS